MDLGYRRDYHSPGWEMKGRAEVDPASSDVALLCHAPQVVSEAYRRARSTIGDARDLLSWRLGFVDTVQRFLVAVLAAEHVGFGLPAPKEFTQLLNKIDAPSLGNWGRAAGALATSLLASGRTLVSGPIAELLCERGLDNSWQPSPLVTDLITIVDTRNDLLHGGTVALPDEGTARRELEAIEEPLRRIFTSMSVLHRFPVFYVRTRRERQDGTRTATVLGFAGLEPRQVTIQDASRLNIPDRVPFVRGERGEALLLAPFLVVSRQRGTGTLETRLLYAWNTDTRSFIYSELRSNERTGVDLEEGDDDAEPGTPLTRLRNRPPAAGRRDDAVPQSLAELVFGAETTGTPSISGYQIEGVLGRGAAGIVYAARELFQGGGAGPLVALKRLDPGVAQHLRERLRREHQVLSQLQHPGIVRALCFVDNASQGTFLVMDYAQGEDLQRRIEQGPIPQREAIRIVRDVLQALAAAHAANVVHRDIKPSNVIVAPDGAVRLIDFGVAMAASEQRLTRTLDAVGTLDYASPEQQRGQAEPVSDVYSVGRLLWCLVRGRLDAPGAPTELPPGLHAIVRRATQPHPRDRFRTASEMLAALDDRERANWGGAPVEAGDRLDESFGLREIHSPAVQGVTICDAVELLTEEPVSIALAVLGTPAGNRLSDAFRRCPPVQRRAIGARGLQRTRDGLIFAIFDGGEALRRVRELLRDSSDASPPPDAPPTTPPYLEALHRGILQLNQRPATERVTEGAERARWLLQILLDTADRDAPLSERLARWAHRCSAPLVGVVNDAEAASALARDLASDLVELAEARLKAAQGAPSGPGTDCSFLGQLAALVAERTHALSPAALSPMLEELDGRWAILELLGTHVGYLDLESGAALRAPLPALTAIEAARHSTVAAVGRVAANVIARSLRGAQVEVRDQVLWLAHIRGDRGLVARLESLASGDSIRLRVDGVVGTWLRMRDGLDGRPTLGLKPVGAAADAWRKAYRGREARPLVEIAIAPSSSDVASAPDVDVVLPSDAGPSPAGVEATP